MKITLLTSSMIASSLLFAACAADEPDANEDTQEVAASGSGCAQVMLFVTRASTEAAGDGITGNLASAIISASKQTVNQTATVYPATLQNYASSSLQGIQALTSNITNEVAKCPNEKIVLLGYSQGAHVSIDVLAGGQGGSLGTATAPLASNLASHITAVAVFGDPRHVTGQAMDLGTSTTNGQFPRSTTQLNVIKNNFGGRIDAWCDANDEFCSSGNSLQVHLTYLNRYQTAAQNFVIGKIGG